jgi:hypothetical protein
MLISSRRDIGCQGLPIFKPSRLLALCCLMLPKNTANKPFGGTVLSNHKYGTSQGIMLVDKHPFKISLSIVRSEAARLNRLFFSMKFFQALHLLTLHAALFGLPSVVGGFRVDYQSCKLSYISLLHPQHYQVLQFVFYLFRLIPFLDILSRPSRLISYTSGRTIFLSVAHNSLVSY